jgi:hypothetical protein
MAWRVFRFSLGGGVQLASCCWDNWDPRSKADAGGRTGDEVVWYGLVDINAMMVSYMRQLCARLGV